MKLLLILIGVSYLSVLDFIVFQLQHQAHILASLINSTEAGDLLRGNGALHAMLDAHAAARSHAVSVGD